MKDASIEFWIRITLRNVWVLFLAAISGKWHHVAFVKYGEDNRIVVYLNGEKKTEFITKGGVYDKEEGNQKSIGASTKED